jgi:hypothetical protein
MPMGKGTYGSKVGRPPKKNKNGMSKMKKPMGTTVKRRSK